MFILGQGAMCAEDSESIFNFSLIASNSSFVTTPSALLIFADKIIKANAKIC